MEFGSSFDHHFNSFLLPFHDCFKQYHRVVWYGRLCRRVQRSWHLGTLTGSGNALGDYSHLLYHEKKVVVMDYYGLALECPVSIYGEGSGNHCHRVRNVYASLCTQDAPISQPSCKSFFRRFCHIYHHLHGATPYRQREWRGKYGVV